MKLVILGATGQTGLCLVQQALAAGHRVVVGVRNPDKLVLVDDNLQVEIADIFSSESLYPLFVGCDAVLSCLGSGGIFSAVTLYSESMKHITAAMRRANVKRLVCITSWYTEVDPNDDPGFVARWFVRPMLKYVLLDMSLMEQCLVSDCQDINFTSVRPSQLVNSEETDKDFVVEERYFANSSGKISRADVARFMLQCLQLEQYYKKLLAIGIPA